MLTSTSRDRDTDLQDPICVGRPSRPWLSRHWVRQFHARTPRSGTRNDSPALLALLFLLMAGLDAHHTIVGSDLYVPFGIDVRQLCTNHQCVSVVKLLHAKPLLAVIELEQPAPTLGPSKARPNRNVGVPMYQCHGLLHSRYGLSPPRTIIRRWRLRDQGQRSHPQGTLRSHTVPEKPWFEDTYGSMTSHEPFQDVRRANSGPLREHREGEMTKVRGHV